MAAYAWLCPWRLEPSDEDRKAEAALRITRAAKRLLAARSDTTMKREEEEESNSSFCTSAIEDQMSELCDHILEEAVSDVKQVDILGNVHGGAHPVQHKGSSKGKLASWVPTFAFGVLVVVAALVVGPGAKRTSLPKEAPRVTNSFAAEVAARQMQVAMWEDVYLRRSPAHPKEKRMANETKTPYNGLLRLVTMKAMANNESDTTAASLTNHERSTVLGTMINAAVAKAGHTGALATASAHMLLRELRQWVVKVLGVVRTKLFKVCHTLGGCRRPHSGVRTA